MNKSTIQQLKSILDDLSTQFRDQDKIMTMYNSAHRDSRRAKHKHKKLVNQIPVLTQMIKFLQEVEPILQWCRDSAPIEISDRAYKLKEKYETTSK